jgi:hypothetical protein
MFTRIKSGLAAVAVLAALVSFAASNQPGRADDPVAPANARTVPESSRRSAKQDLTLENFSKLHALIRPHDEEWRHLRVQWLTDVVAARKKAAAEDKPIIICYTGGAGYNEPLGTC